MRASKQKLRNSHDVCKCNMYIVENFDFEAELLQKFWNNEPLEPGGSSANLIKNIILLVGYKDKTMGTKRPPYFSSWVACRNAGLKL